MMKKSLVFLCFAMLATPLFVQSAVLNVKDFGAVANDGKDDSAAFQKCLDQLVSLGGGDLVIPFGRYQITHLTFFGKKYSNIHIKGNNATIEQIFTTKKHMIDRWNTYSLRNAADGCFIMDAKVSKQFDDKQSLKNISISNLNFWTDNKKYGFDELTHQISAHGVSNLTINQCTFTGFLGDGIAINAGTDFKENYGAYNKNVTITNCKFDGVTKDNRQGISFYYCDGFLVENCNFKNTTREDMPGAIDVEPMDDWQIARNGTIKNCDFENIGGIAAILVFLRKQSTETNVKHSYGYVIENCRFNNVRTPVAVIGNDDYLKFKGGENLVTFKNSTIRNFKNIVYLSKAYGVYFDNNKFQDNDVNYTYKQMNEFNFFTINNSTFKNTQVNDKLFFDKGSKNFKFNRSSINDRGRKSQPKFFKD